MRKADFDAKGAVILGCSPDPVKKNCSFADKQVLSYSLLCDTEREVIQAYGAWGRKKFMGKEYDGVIRSTFVIDDQGRVAHVFPAVKVKGHDEAVLAVL